MVENDCKFSAQYLNIIFPLASITIPIFREIFVLNMLFIFKISQTMVY